MIGDNYRHRGLGESTFGSITNQYGGRLKTKKTDTITSRISARLTAHTKRIQRSWLWCCGFLKRLDMLLVMLSLLEKLFNKPLRGF